MSVVLERIRANGGDLTRDKWNLHLRPGRLSKPAIAWIKANKARVLEEVWGEYDDWQERAAIREFDAGQSRSEAEEAAYLEVMRRAERSAYREVKRC